VLRSLVLALAVSFAHAAPFDPKALSLLPIVDLRPDEALAASAWRRYRRSAEALATDLHRALASHEGLLFHESGGLAWFFSRHTLGLGGYLKLLAVPSDRVGQGIGAALLLAFEAAVAKESRHAFLLVSDFNTDAQRFYERHGYTRVGALPGLVLADVDELVYWKRV